jgi:hypothetical protein
LCPKRTAGAFHVNAPRCCGRKFWTSIESKGCSLAKELPIIILNTKIAAEARADLLERREWFALRMKNFARPPDEPLTAERGLDDMLLPGLRDGRKGDDVPFLLRQDMAHEIVLVEALHDEDDRAFRFVV